MVPYKSLRGEWVFTRTDQAWGLPGYMWATLIAARSPDSSVCRDRVFPTPTRQAISTDSDSFRPRPEAISAHRAIVSALALLVCCKFSKWTEKRARARRSLADSGQVWTARHSRCLKTKQKHMIPPSDRGKQLEVDYFPGVNDENNNPESKWQWSLFQF